MSDSVRDSERAPVARRGHDDAARARFAEQYQRCWRTLWCIAVSVLGDRCGAEDVVQEAAVIGMRKYGEFREGTNFAAWMGSIVRLTALNHSRRGRRERPSQGSLGADCKASPTPAPDPERLVDSRGRLADDEGSFDDRTIRALNCLEPTARACLLLRTVLDQSYKEISRTLDIPEGTAMSHVHRARRTLREKLSGGADSQRQGSDA